MVFFFFLVCLFDYLCGTIVIIIMGASSWLFDSEFVICCLEDLMIRIFMNICFMNRVVLNGNTLSTNICPFIRKEKLYLSSYFNLLNC